MADTPPADDSADSADAVTPPPPAEEVAAALLEEFPGTTFNDSHRQPVVYVDRARWHDVARYLRDEQQFTQCTDITAVDHLLDEQRLRIDGVAPERFEVVANFLSHPRNRRVRVIAQLPAAHPNVASLVDLYPGVENPEREVYDLLGIIFDDHPELTRILMPEDWVGHPLRKDAPGARVPVTFKGDRTPR